MLATARALPGQEVKISFAREMRIAVRNSFEEPGGNDEALDFASAFVDFGDAGVAVVAFDGIFATVAVATVNLNGFVRDAGGHFAGEELCGGGVHAEARAGVLFPRGLADEQAGRVAV